MISMNDDFPRRGSGVDAMADLAESETLADDTLRIDR